MSTPPDITQTPLAASKVVPTQEAEADPYEGADVDQSVEDQAALGREFLDEYKPTFKKLGL